MLFGIRSNLYVYLSLSHPSATLKIMRKTPFDQGKEQPREKYVVGAAADISCGSQGHEQQGAGDGTSNTEPRADFTFTLKHAQQIAGGETSNE